MQVEDRTETSVTTTMPASPWFSMFRRDVEPGIITAFSNQTATFVSTQLAGNRRAVTFEVTFSILRQCRRPTAASCGRLAKLGGAG